MFDVHDWYDSVFAMLMGQIEPHEFHLSELGCQIQTMSDAKVAPSEAMYIANKFCTQVVSSVQSFLLNRYGLMPHYLTHEYRVIGNARLLFTRKHGATLDRKLFINGLEITPEYINVNDRGYYITLGGLDE